MIGVAEGFDIAGFALDTLIWTGVLIALVLVLRRSVTKTFGAPTAYALWLLPMMRLLLPPIELPAWLAPTKPAPEAMSGVSTDLVILTSDVAPAAAAPIDRSVSILDVLAGLPWSQLLMAIWLIGAAVFLYMRFSAYFRLRNELLESACEVGVAKGPFGPIRLIETPGTTAPLAFGVVSPVIALPPGFMALPDRASRDLALAHELAHHRGFDLLINILAQPLFAIHWFNPLARYGWLALRRDQEAACDARVIGEAPKESRALYASVIASFAAGPNVALAAPMACPVLGDKSIVQRLRNLKMTDQSSNTPRRLASRLMIGGAILALPLTASITYAESFAPEPPAPPVPTLAALGVQSAPEAPQPPKAPTPPSPPEAPEVEREVTIIKIDPDTGAKTKAKYKLEDEEAAMARAEAWEARTEAQAARSMAMIERDAAKREATMQRRYKTVHIVRDGEELEEAELELIMKEVRDGLAEADRALDEVRVELRALENEEGIGRVTVKMECSSNSDDVATTIEREDGSSQVLLCQSRVIMEQALIGLKQARSAIADNSEMSTKMRKDVLKEIDKQIKNWEKEAR